MATVLTASFLVAIILAAVILKVSTFAARVVAASTPTTGALLVVATISMAVVPEAAILTIGAFAATVPKASAFRTGAFRTAVLRTVTVLRTTAVMAGVPASSDIAIGEGLPARPGTWEPVAGERYPCTDRPPPIGPLASS
jgi:hypothetical protein